MEKSVVDRDIIRNHIDTIILHLINEKERYGYEVYKEVLDRTNGAYELKEPSLYSAFRRLEENKLISSFWGNESQGGRRKYYRITDEGIKSYKQALLEWDSAQQIINTILGRGNCGGNK